MRLHVHLRISQMKMKYKRCTESRKTKEEEKTTTNMTGSTRQGKIMHDKTKHYKTKLNTTQNDPVPPPVLWQDSGPFGLQGVALLQLVHVKVTIIVIVWFWLFLLPLLASLSLHGRLHKLESLLFRGSGL